MEEGRVESIVVGTDGSDTAGDAVKVSHRATCNVLIVSTDR